jgi:hypothetical protein
MHKYTREQGDFISENVKGRTTKELTELFNKKFNLNLKLNQIRAYIKNHKLKSGIDGTFKKRNTPWNKGKKGLSIGGKETQFIKGHKPHNWVPIGTERTNGDNYIEIKVADGKLQKNWKGKHVIVWEQHNGKLPKGYGVIFGDGNKKNLDINNLIAVSRQQLLTLNKNNLIQKDADLTRSAVIVADIYSKIHEKKRGQKNG